MLDEHGREINYLRISVTDKCNLRCNYCMPEDGVKSLDHKDILRIEEIEEIVKAAARMGIMKVRLTGGEPLIRRGIEEIVDRIGRIDGIDDIGITTNAILLPEKAEMLKAAGVKRLNISLDTLDPEKYTQITRGGKLEDALRGIDAAVAHGFDPIKINVVLMGGVNDDEITDFMEFAEEKGLHIRFIEIMPIGECANWNKDRFVGVSKVLEVVPELEFLKDDGVSKIFAKPGSGTTVGLISPISSHFCPVCNKVRVTSDGKLKPCLHSSDELSLKGLGPEELEVALAQGISEKPFKHDLDDGEISASARNMNAIGG